MCVWCSAKCVRTVTPSSLQCRQPTLEDYILRPYAFDPYTVRLLQIHIVNFQRGLVIPYKALQISNRFAPSTLFWHLNNCMT